MMRRVWSLAIVAAAAAIAYAALPGNALDATPEVVVVQLGLGQAMPGTSSVGNPDTSSVAVAAITRLPCDDPGMTITSPASSFAIGGGAQQAVTFSCPSTSSYGMRRCTYHLQSSAMEDVGTFMGVCAASTSATLGASPSTVTFPSVPVGTTQTQTITITNSGPNATRVGTLQLQTTDLDGNVLIGAPCSTNENGCDVANVSLGTFTVDVQCHPSSAATVTRELHVVDQFGDRLAAPVSISCTGTAVSGAALDVTTIPAPLSLGLIEVLGGSATGDVRIQNVGGSGTLTISTIAISGAGTDWTYMLGAPCNGTLPCALAPGVFVDAAVKFRPSELGPRDATMTIASSDPNNSQLDVALSGVGQGATVQLAAGQPATIDMGDVPRNGSASLAIHLANTGNRDVTDVSLALSSSTQFSTMPASPTSSFTVAHGAAPTDVVLTCAPGGATGMFSTTLTANAPDTLSATAVTVMATCRGTDSLLAAKPSSIQLGEVRTGTTPNETLELDNLGGSTLTLAQQPAVSPAVTGVSVSTLGTLAISGNGSASVQLSVDPQNDGDIATAIAAGDSGANTTTVPVTGKIVTATVTTPPTVALGTFCVNQPTRASTIALTSTGTATVTLGSAPRMATAGSPFELAPKSPASYPGTLASSALATVDVLPRRQSDATDVSDDVVWTTDIANDLNPRTTVSASFLATGAALAPASLDFGPESIHLYMNDALPLTIQNCSGPTIMLSPSVDPPFSIDSDFPTTLASAEPATFAVGFHPTKVGLVTKTLRVTTSDQQVLEVSLTGVGVANGVPDDAGSGSGGYHATSFYSCGCRSGGPGGVAPIALAFALVLRRRRQ
jgi:MYXO-CTERM domain-containing protein